MILGIELFFPLDGLSSLPCAPAEFGAVSTIATKWRQKRSVLHSVSAAFFNVAVPFWNLFLNVEQSLGRSSLCTVHQFHNSRLHTTTAPAQAYLSISVLWLFTNLCFQWLCKYAGHVIELCKTTSQRLVTAPTILNNVAAVFIYTGRWRILSAKCCAPCNLSSPIDKLLDINGVCFSCHLLQNSPGFPWNSNELRALLPSKTLQKLSKNHRSTAHIPSSPEELCLDEPAASPWIKYAMAVSSTNTRTICDPSSSENRRSSRSMRARGSLPDRFHCFFLRICKNAMRDCIRTWACFVWFILMSWPSSSP